MGATTLLVQMVEPVSMSGTVTELASSGRRPCSSWTYLTVSGGWCTPWGGDWSSELCVTQSGDSACQKGCGGACVAPGYQKFSSDAEAEDYCSKSDGCKGYTKSPAHGGVWYKLKATITGAMGYRGYICRQKTCSSTMWQEEKNSGKSGYCLPFSELCKTGSPQKNSPACAGSLANGYRNFGNGNDVAAQQACETNDACAGYTKSNRSPGYFKLKSQITGVQTYSGYECWRKPVR